METMNEEIEVVNSSDYFGPVLDHYRMLMKNQVYKENKVEVFKTILSKTNYTNCMLPDHINNVLYKPDKTVDNTVLEFLTEFNFILHRYGLTLIDLSDFIRPHMLLVYNSEIGISVTNTPEVSELLKEYIDEHGVLSLEIIGPIDVLGEYGVLLCIFMILSYDFVDMVKEELLASEEAVKKTNKKRTLVKNIK